MARDNGGWFMLKFGAVMFAGMVLVAGAAQAGALPALYAAQQASAGAGIYAQDCAMCHGADLKGGAGPALIGESFAPTGGSTTLGGVFTIVAQQMPATAPGSLTQAQDDDVMAYILKSNGYPAGAAPLAYNGSLGSTQSLASQVK